MSGSSQHDRARRRRFQFSLRWLFVVTAIVAVAAAVGGVFYQEMLARERAVEFFQAVERGDLSETDRLLNIDPHLAHGREHHGVFFPLTALQTALMSGGNLQVVDRILQEKPDLEEKSDKGKTALQRVSAAHNAAAVTLLLHAGAKVDTRDAIGQTALHYAMLENNERAVQLLRQHGADLTAKDDAGLIPGERSDGTNSEVAANVWWEKIVEAHDSMAVTELDAVPQVLRFRLGYTPSTMLHRAVRARRLDVLDYLLRRDNDVNLQDLDGSTPLHLTAWTRQAGELPQRLLDAGAELDAQDELGRTPLHWAAIAHNTDFLSLLIAAGADVTAQDHDGASVMDLAFERTFHDYRTLPMLHSLRVAGHPPTVLYAAATGDLELLRELTRDDAGALDRAYTRNGIRPLHAAVMGEQPRVVEWLIDKGVDRDASGAGGAGAPPVDPPLMMALSYNKVEIALLLIELGVDVNGKGRSGHRPVQAVVDWDRDPKILEALIAHAADLTLTYQNKSLRELALEARDEHRARYLELLGAGGRDEDGG